MTEDEKQLKKILSAIATLSSSIITQARNLKKKEGVGLKELEGAVAILCQTNEYFAKIATVIPDNDAAQKILFHSCQDLVAETYGIIDKITKMPFIDLNKYQVYTFAKVSMRKTLGEILETN